MTSKNKPRPTIRYIRPEVGERLDVLAEKLGYTDRAVGRQRSDLIQSMVALYEKLPELQQALMLAESANPSENTLLKIANLLRKAGVSQEA